MAIDPVNTTKIQTPQKPKLNARIVFSALTMLLLFACGGGSGDSTSTGTVTTETQIPQLDPPVATVPPSNTNPMPTTPELGDELPIEGDETLSNVGDIIIGGGNGQIEQNQDLGDLLPKIYSTQTGLDPRFGQAGATLVAALNDNLILPRDIPVHFTDCQQENAFYTSDASELSPELAGPNIFMCYELIAAFLNYYGDNNQAFLASAFVLVHELGHALVDQLELPVLGIEESYVDGIAAVFAGEGDLAEATILAGFFFGSQDQSPWFDSHRSGPQRFGDLACWAIGAEPNLRNDEAVANYANQLVESGRDCEAEYQQQLRGLTAVLSPHIRGGLGDGFSTINEGDINFGPTNTPGETDPSEQPTSDGSVQFWDVSYPGDILYLYTDTASGDVFLLDPRNDQDAQNSGGTVGECYEIYHVNFTIEELSADSENNLYLDNELVGFEVDPGAVTVPYCGD